MKLAPDSSQEKPVVVSPVTIALVRCLTKGLQDSAEVAINTSTADPDITKSMLDYYRGKGRSIIQCGEHLYISKKSPLDH